MPSRIDNAIIYTEIGNAPLNSEASDNDKIWAIFRPDDLYIENTGTTNGVIDGRSFHGSSYMYNVTLHSGNMLHVLAPHTQILDIGIKVNVSISPNHPISYLSDGEPLHN